MSASLNGKENHFSTGNESKRADMMRFKLLRAEEVDNSSEAKVQETKLEAAASWTISDIKRSIEDKVDMSAAFLYAGGKRLVLTSMAASMFTRALTWTTNDPGMRIVEAVSVQYLLDRGEAYRVLPALKVLRDFNTTYSTSSKATRASSGSGGAYFLKNTTVPGGLLLACFKPRDDEPGAKNNPNESGRRNGILPGESAEREVAAFVLDWGGFSGVPATVLAEAACDTLAPDEHNLPKIGSFQYFVQNAPDNVGDFSPHLFPAHEVHKIGLMDLRFLNLDRNDSNILVVHRHSDEYRLIPIDHGLCFPDRIEVGWCDWVWYDWPQTLMPFDAETKAWVLGLDVEEDISLLRRCFSFRPECIRLYRCMVMLLKKCVAANLNLRDIASVVVRAKNIDEPSAMEKTITRATELARLMESNARVKASGGSTLHRSSSFDGNLASLATTERSVSDELFFAYVDRLLEDVVAEILDRKAVLGDLTDRHSGAGGWFSASARSSPCELTKIASPRLLPGKWSPSNSRGSDLSSSFPFLNLQQ
jgi:hypothetical protein